MVFSDPIFVFGFLPVSLLLLWALGGRGRNELLCVLGTIFYIWGGGAFVLVLLTTIVVNHLGARRLAIVRARSGGSGRWLLRGLIAADLAVLAVWKYGPFAVGQAATLLRRLGVDAHADLHLVLPIAISFYTFQCISYLVDVWNRRAEPAPRLADFAASILLFPHLIAGPIVRFAHIEQDLLRPSRRRFDDFAAGAPRFFWGLAKKVVVADQVAIIADRIFADPTGNVSSTAAWLGVLAYAVQIYFDFSGYSDMAIGLARMFGFGFPENFDRPYSSVSVTDFWRRWHMSLSSWFRDYVYIPLGGNRRGRGRAYLNLSIVFLLTGLWHGANWTFIVWGAFHGACLVIERATGLARDETHAIWPRRLVTFALVCVGWALFRASDVPQAARIIRAMVIPRGVHLRLEVREVLTHQRIVWLVVGLAVVLLPRRAHIGRWVSEAVGRRGDVLRLAVVCGLAPIAATYTLSSSFSPFLYFKF